MTASKELTTPFTKRFVIQRTLDGMRSNVSFSIGKTMSRLGDFEDDPQKKSEVLDTLSALSALLNLINSIEEDNIKFLKEELNK